MLEKLFGRGLKPIVLVVVCIGLLAGCGPKMPTGVEMERDLKSVREDKMQACGYLGSPIVEELRILETKRKGDILTGRVWYKLSNDVPFIGKKRCEEEWTFRYIRTQKGWEFDGIGNCKESRVEEKETKGRHIVFEVVNPSNLSSREFNNYIEENCRIIAKLISDHGVSNFGVYRMGSRRIIVQISPPEAFEKIHDSLLLPHLAIIEKRTVIGPIGFKFKRTGIMVQFKSLNKINIADLEKTLSAKIRDYEVQMFDEGRGYLIWVDCRRSSREVTNEVVNIIASFGGTCEIQRREEVR